MNPAPTTPHKTTVFFVRHSETDRIHYQGEERLRPLTDVGRERLSLVTELLSTKNIDAIYSSPYLRCLETIRPFAQLTELPVVTIEQLGERVVGTLTDPFDDFARHQWEDFDYHLPDGESLRQVQERNIGALKEILISHPGENLAICTHGTALSTILHYYNPNFGYQGFQNICDKTPHVVKAEFQKTDLLSYLEINVLDW